MRLYLVQHGEAVAKTVDPDRPLSARGREEVERMATFLKTAGIEVGQVIHSGKARALQTAEILATALSPGQPPSARSGLNPNDPVTGVVEQLADFGGNTMLVGHLPFMARLVTHLLGGGEEQTAVAFQFGSVVCVAKDDAGAWQLQWMVRPELLG